MSEIAAAENLTGSYVTRVLRLAFLMPNIVEAILTGTQPAELTPDRILRAGTLPLTWHEQHRHLGFLSGTGKFANSDAALESPQIRASLAIPRLGHELHLSTPAKKRVFFYIKKIY